MARETPISDEVLEKLMIEEKEIIEKEIILAEKFYFLHLSCVPVLISLGFRRLCGYQYM